MTVALRINFDSHDARRTDIGGFLVGRYTRFLMTGLLVIMVPLGAWAGVGLRIGTGISMVDDKTDVPGLDDPEVTPFAVVFHTT